MQSSNDVLRRTPDDVVVIGLTGGIATGKSTTTELLREITGAVVLNADHFGHVAYKPGTQCLTDLVAHFGERILGEDGAVDRTKLGPIVFQDPSEMQALNRIVWPAIRDLIQQAIHKEAASLRAAQPDPAALRVIVLEAAVMIEAGWTDLADEVWVTTTEKEVAKARLMQRNNLSEEQALSRINSQITNEERRIVAHVELTNNGDEEALAAQVGEKVESLRARYARLSAYELVDVVDRHDQVQFAAKRAVVRDFGLIHRCTYAVLATPNGNQYYVQRRSKLKDSGPGLLDPAPGGVVGAGESYEANVVRELEEEMGLRGLQLKHVAALWHESEKDGRFWGTIFSAQCEVPVDQLRLQKDEVDSVELMTLDEIRATPESEFLACGLAAFNKYIEATNGGASK